MHRIRHIVGATVAVLTSIMPAAAADLSPVKDKGVLRALTTGDDKPNVYMDPSGKPVGFEVDMCDMVAGKLGVKLDLGVLAWEGLLPSISTKRTDMVCSGVNITEARTKAFDFSVPYSRTAIIAMVPAANTDISGPTDIKGKMVGACIGADGEDVVRQIGGFRDVRVYPGVAELFPDLLAKRIDVAIVGDKQAAEFMLSRPGQFKIVGKPYKVNLVGYPLSKGSADMKAALDKIITDARRDGTLNAMAKAKFNLDDYDSALPPPGQDAKF